jgi:hypothetical protein
VYDGYEMGVTRTRRSRRFVVTAVLLSFSVLALAVLAVVLLDGTFADAAGSCGGG